MQLNASPLSLLMLAAGAVLLNVVVTDVDDEHPVLYVTVTVYVPAVVMLLIVAVVAPVLHKYEAPALAVKFVDVVVQFRSNPLFAVILVVGGFAGTTSPVLSIVAPLQYPVKLILAN